MFTRSSYITTIAIAIASFSILGVFIFTAHGASTKLDGYVLIDPIGGNRLWYVSPVDHKRYDLGFNSSDAIRGIKKTAIGISNADLLRVPAYNESKTGNVNLRQRLSGRFLIAVGQNGALWYVYPKNVKRYYFKPIDTSFTFLRSLALAPSPTLLASIPIAYSQPMQNPTPAAANGCSFNNPPCADGQQCVNNACVIPPVPTAVSAGCAYNNPSCAEGQQCTDNQCVANIAPAPPTSACVTPICLADHQAVAYDGSASGTVTGTYLLAIGATKEILPNVFVRAESSKLGTIWVKKNNVCYIKKVIIPTYGLVVGDKFVVMDTEADSLRFNVYGGYNAYDICKQKNTEPTLAIFCEALPKPDSYIITGKMFDRVFDGTQYAPAQSLSVDMDDIAYSKDINAYPAIAESQPFTGKWQITDIKSANMPNGAAGYTDLENIVVADDYVMKNTTYSYLNNYSTNSNDYQNAMNAVKNSNPNDIYISNLVWGPFNAETHEFTHGIFGNSGMMLGSYTGYSGILVEGWANYISNIGNLSAAYRQDWSNRYCGETQFINPPNPPENFSDMINSNPYSAGFCFFSAVEKACGTNTINSFIDKMLTEPSAPQASYPHPLKILGDFCPDKNKYQTILNNFGINETLMTDSDPLVPNLLPGNACGT